MTALRMVQSSHGLERAKEALATAAEFADSVDRENRFPAETVNALKRMGLLSIAIPVDLGGEGASLGELCTIAQGLGGACASTGMIFAMHQICLANLLDCAMDSEWHRDLARRMLAEPLLFASATTEGGVGGDLRQSICAVERQGDRIVLSKDASVISYGEYADAIFATARRDADAAFSDQVLVVLMKEQCELDRTSTWDTLGMRGTCSHGYRLKAQAGACQIMPKQFADIAADSMVAISHLLWSSVWCGIAAAALGRAQTYVAAQARNASGQVPAGAMRLAEIFGRLQSIEASINSVLEQWERARHHPTFAVALAVNALKLSVSTEALNVVNDALLICGLQGYKNGGPYSVGRHLRDIHSARLMISNERIAAATGQLMLMQRRRARREKRAATPPSLNACWPRACSSPAGSTVSMGGAVLLNRSLRVSTPSLRG
jgi:acyl-CoA dehydrogenase